MTRKNDDASLQDQCSGFGTSRSNDNASMKPGLVSGFAVAGAEQTGLQ